MRLARRLLIVVVLLLSLAGITGVRLYRWATAPFPVESHEVMVTIPSGATAREVGVILEREGVVRHRLLIPLMVRLRGDVIKAGRYRFDEPLTPQELLRLLGEGGEPAPFRRITIPEGLRLDQVAELAAMEGLGSCQELSDLMRDPTPVADLDPWATDLEGYLFPDTYHLDVDAGPSDLVEAMVARFREVASRLSGEPELGFPTRYWVTLASLVERETPLPQERPVVASVYTNRLDKGILLQCDPTIIYAFVKAGLPARELRSSDLDFPHVYNTYLHPGLPPGPICSPGEAALAAALNPADTDYIFFVARGDGGHTFSRTLREHNAAVRKYRRVMAARRRGQGS